MSEIMNILMFIDCGNTVTNLCMKCSLKICRIIGEIILMPISLPCSIYRRIKYNIWLQQWRSELDDDDKNVMRYIFKKLTYRNLNNYKTNVPECILQKNRYFWNFTPDKTQFFEHMDEFLKKVKRSLLNKVNANNTSV